MIMTRRRTRLASIHQSKNLKLLNRPFHEKMIENKPNMIWNKHSYDTKRIFVRWIARSLRIIFTNFLFARKGFKFRFRNSINLNAINTFLNSNFKHLAIYSVFLGQLFMILWHFGCCQSPFCDLSLSHKGTVSIPGWRQKT